MKKSLLIILGFIKKEFAQALRDPVMRVLIFVAPVVQLTLFGYAINNEFKNIKLAVYSAPGDSMARQLTSRFYSSKWFLPVSDDKREGNPVDMLTKGAADAVLVMPTGGFTKAYGQGNANLQLLIDASNATKARSVDSYVRAIVQQFIGERSASAAAGQTQPVTFDVRVLYNPTMETSIFMVPGIMSQIMTLLIIIMTAMALAREKELGTYETIIAAPVRNRDIILGKAIPYVIIGLVDAMIVLTAGKILFDVPIRGSILYLALATGVYVATTVSVGLFISTIAKTQQQAMMGSFLFMFPSIMLSGVIFPVENMPESIRVFAYLNPMMYFVRIVRNVMLKGANPDLVFRSIGILALLGSVVISVAISRFKQKLN